MCIQLITTNSLWLLIGAAAISIKALRIVTFSLMTLSMTMHIDISTMTLVGIGCLCWILLCRVSLMLSIANMPSMLSVIMLNVSLLFVVAPYICLQTFVAKTLFIFS